MRKPFGDLVALLGRSWSPSEPVGALLGPLERVLEASWLALGSILDAFGTYLEVISELVIRL